MEPKGSGQVPVEVLDTGPPGALERWWATWPHRRTAVLVGVVVLAAGGWFAWAAGEGEPVDGTAAETAPTAAPPGLRPPPARGRDDGTGTWRVSQDVSIRSGPSGHTITFFAVNEGDEPQDPTRFRVAASFVDRAGLDYQASCVGVRLTPRGYRPVRAAVQPDQEVFVRCTDTTRYGATVAWIDPKTVLVSTEPCEESRGVPGV